MLSGMAMAQTGAEVGVRASGTIAPWWAVAPLAAVTMLVLAVHLGTLPRVEMPESRRRLRTVNGWLMLLVVPLAAYGFGVADPSVNGRVFVMVWMMVAGLLVLVIGLAAADVINTWRLHRKEVREIREHLTEAKRLVGESADATVQTKA